MEKRPGETAGRSVPPRLGTAGAGGGAGRVAPPGPPPRRRCGLPAQVFRARGWAEEAALTPLLVRAGAPALPAFRARGPGACGLRPARADSSAGRGAWDREQARGLPGESSFEWPLCLGWPRLRHHPPTPAQ